MTAPERPRMLIHWLDTAGAEGRWMQTASVVHDLPLNDIETVGWVLHEDDNSLIIAGSHTMDWTSVGEVLHIPKAAILDRRPI